MMRGKHSLMGSAVCSGLTAQKTLLLAFFFVISLFEKLEV